VGLDVPPDTLSRFDHVVLVGANAPVSFFAQPGRPSRQTRSDAQLHVLNRPEQDAVAALRALVEALNAPHVPVPDAGARPMVGSGTPTPAGLAQTLAALMPEGSIVSDESVTFGHGLFRHTQGAPRHDWLHLTGGAIGDGMPVATGAALAGGGRRVINLQADGSGMYSLQSLWTQARERLPVTTIVISNRKYQILIGEYKKVGAVPGPTAMRMLDLGNPDLDWVKLAEGMGVEAARADTMEQCADLLRRSLHSGEPFLIELVV
jgi:acetolactate synthase-1/2/3 large subunit